MKRIAEILSLMLAMLFVFSFSGCSQKDEVITGNKVKFTMENGGEFIIELYPEYAPETCENFKTLVSEGFYDGLTFHRVIDDFMAQGGDPELSDRTDSEGGFFKRILEFFGGNNYSVKEIKGEFARNGFKQNTLSHTRGVVSMARTPISYDSASTQFFICYTDVTFLDGDYAAFGKVIEGMEVVDAFLEVERDYDANGERSAPETPIIIEKAEVISDGE